jgi:hypothetical protein
VGPVASTIELEEDVDDGSPRGTAVSPAVSTTDFEDDVDGGPSGERCRWVQQCSPPRLKKTSMVGPLGALPADPVTSTTNVEVDVDGRSPRGGTAGRSGSVHH